MNDETTGGTDSSRPISDASSDGRRQSDRRKSQQPFDGPDRRKGDRRTGSDRRTAPRAEGLADGDD